MRSEHDFPTLSELRDFTEHRMTAQGHPATIPLSPHLAEASTRTTSSARLATLALLQDTEVRAAVAEHPNTALSTLHQLAADADWIVLGAVARNPHTPAQDLAQVAHQAWAPSASPSSFRQHLTTFVKMGLLQNPQTPHNVVETYGIPESDGVLRRLAERWLTRYPSAGEEAVS
jgi:hypothetical protein